MRKLQDLKNRGCVGFDFAPVENSLIDNISGEAATIVSSIGLSWRNVKNGRALSFKKKTIGRLRFSDTVANRLSGSGWLITVGDHSQAAGRAWCKRDGGGINYDIIYAASESTITIFDGVRTLSFTYDFKRATVVGIHFLGEGRKAELWVDGAQVAVLPNILVIAEETAPLVVGNYYSGSANSANCAFSRMIILNDEGRVTNEDYAELVAELMTENGAGEPKTRNFRELSKIYASDSRKWAPTFIDVTTGQVSNTDFYVNSGKWKVSEDDLSAQKKKWIQGLVGTSNIYMLGNNSAYGTWVFEIHKTDTSANAVARFITNKKGLYNDAGTQGYYLAFLADESIGLFEHTASPTYKRMGSAPATLALSTDYKFAVTRNALHQFAVYLKGGIYTDWQLLPVTLGTNPMQLTTYTTSKYFVFEENAATGTKYNLLGIHPMVLSLEELKKRYP